MTDDWKGTAMRMRRCFEETLVDYFMKASSKTVGGRYQLVEERGADVARM